MVPQDGSEWLSALSLRADWTIARRPGFGSAAGCPWAIEQAPYFIICMYSLQLQVLAFWEHFGAKHPAMGQKKGGPAHRALQTVVGLFKARCYLTEGQWKRESSCVYWTGQMRTGSWSGVHRDGAKGGQPAS